MHHFHIILPLIFWESLSRDKRDDGFEVLGDGDKLQKAFFTQTISDKIYETMSGNQAKLDKTRRLWNLFITYFFWSPEQTFYMWKRAYNHSQDAWDKF